MPFDGKLYDPYLTVGLVAITFTVMTNQRWPDTRQLILGFHQASVHEIVCQKIAFAVDVRRNVVCDLSGITAQSDTAIIG